MKGYKKLLIVNAVVFLLLLFFIVWTIFKFNNFLNAPACHTHKQVYLEIYKGESVPNIIERLKQKKLITRSDWFYYYIRLSGQGHKIKAGVHLFYTDYTPKEVLNELTNSSIYTVRITVLPGYSLRNIANLLNKNNLNGNGLMAISDNATFVEKCSGYYASSLEGFLYPDTYYIERNQNPKNIALIMCKKFKEMFRKITDKKTFSKGDYKKLIVASIIQKEATDEKSMRLVASGIYNRLKRHMYLQMDSTRFLDYKNNTYKHKGLPQTPICNPARKAIEAAYNPEKSNFLYFISKKDGKMVFSKTLKQHDKNIEEYLQ